MSETVTLDTSESINILLILSSLCGFCTAIIYLFWKTVSNLNLEKMRARQVHFNVWALGRTFMYLGVAFSSFIIMAHGYEMWSNVTAAVGGFLWPIAFVRAFVR